MGSRYIQRIELEQKIERLQAQLEYLKRLDALEEKQSSLRESNQVSEEKSSK